MNGEIEKLLNLMEATIKEIRMVLAKSDKLPVDNKKFQTRSCIMCFNYRAASGTCHLCNQKIPANILNTGCDKFEYDDIPF